MKNLQSICCSCNHGQYSWNHVTELASFRLARVFVEVHARVAPPSSPSLSLPLPGFSNEKGGALFSSGRENPSHIFSGLSTSYHPFSIFLPRLSSFYSKVADARSPRVSTLTAFHLMMRQKGSHSFMSARSPRIYIIPHPILRKCKILKTELQSKSNKYSEKFLLR